MEKHYQLFFFFLCNWPYIVSIEEINEKTNSERISIGMKKRRWRWLGHVFRMPRQRHRVTALTWKPDGKRKVGQAQDDLATNSEDGEIWSWQEVLVRQLATDNVRWRKSVKALCTCNRARRVTVPVKWDEVTLYILNYPCIRVWCQSFIPKWFFPLHDVVYLTRIRNALTSFVLYKHTLR